MNKKVKNKRQKYYFLSPLLFMGLLFIVFNFRGSIRVAMTDGIDNTAGWAWSSNIGWISFNCINDTPPCQNSDYGVNLTPATMNISGYAWSDVGWISFEPTGATPPAYSHNFSSHCQSAGADCISSTDCIACYNPDDGKVYGWAQILALGDDGWISLSCDNDDICGTSNYGIHINNSKFRGWAYNGSDNASTSIGWISFNCLNTGTCATSDYEVYFTSIHFPEAHNLTAPNWNYDYACSSGAKGAFLTWDIYDEDGDDQGFYRVIVNDSNTTSTPIIDTGKISSNAEQYFIPSSGVLDYDTRYYWWVRIWDEWGFASDWTQFERGVLSASSTHVLTDNIARNDDGGVSNFTFRPYRHEFPNSDYSFVPDEILKGEIATFTASSTYYTNATPDTAIDCNDSNCDYIWSGSNGVTSITSSTESMTEIIFKYSLDPSVATTSVTLMVTDNELYFCSTTEHIFVDLLPSWKEIKAE